MFCQGFQGSQVFHLQVMCGHAAVTNGLVVKFLQEVLENIIYPHPGKKVPLSDRLIQRFWNISLVAKRNRKANLFFTWRLAENSSETKLGLWIFLPCVAR